MPRKARKKSSMNIYHVILRGINQQIIFEDKHDHVQFTLHAGLERVPGVYPWSSYEAYVVTDDSFIDVDRVLELYTRNQYLKMLHHAGISKRQLSRLTGISRTVIDKAVRGV